MHKWMVVTSLALALTATALSGAETTPKGDPGKLSPPSKKPPPVADPGCSGIVLCDSVSKVCKCMLPGQKPRCDGALSCDKAGTTCWCTPRERTPAASSCRQTTDCPTNAICVDGACRIPDGACNPSTPAALACFPRNVCVPTSSGGLCSVVGPTTAPVFQTGMAVVPLLAPAEGDWQTPDRPFHLRWQPIPAMLASGAITIAIVMDAYPNVDPGSGQIRNRDRVRWMWASNLRGRNGDVSIDEGYAGVQADGQPGAPLSTGRGLPAGRYFFFVYTIQGGRVTASSALRTLRVGRICDARTVSATTCRVAADCTAVVDFPEMADCQGGRCLRRCGSNLDCCGGGETCDMSAPGERRLGVCR